MMLRGLASRRTLAILICAVLSFLVLRDGFAAQFVATGDAAGALAVRPRSAAARSLAAQIALQQGRFAAAAADAAASLASAPMNAAAVRILAVASGRQGDARGGAAALGVAGRLGWRDTPTQILLLVDALDRHDAATASQRADALARRQVELPIAFAGLRAVALEPGGTELLVGRLGQSPAYRTPFLQQADKLLPREYDAREALYGLLQRNVTPPLPAETDPYVKMLIARGEYARAKRVWIRWSGAGASSAQLQDGGFDHLVVGPNGFGWQVIGENALQVTVDDDVERGRSVLQVQGDGSRSALLLQQILIVPPGSHLFALDATQDVPKVTDAFRWTVRCSDTHAELPMTWTSTDLAGQWHRLTGTFDVPEGSCPLQTLELWARSLDSSTPVSARFDRAEMR